MPSPVKTIDGTVFCSPADGFSVFTADKKQLRMSMIDKDGKIILADEFSPDNCRLWDADGNHLDKDVFRRDLGSLTDVYEIVLKKLEELH